MNIREQIALLIHNEIFSDKPERFGLTTEYSLADKILALSDLPESIKKLAMCEELMEALEMLLDKYNTIAEEHKEHIGINILKAKDILSRAKALGKE